LCAAKQFKMSVKQARASFYMSLNLLLSRGKGNDTTHNNSYYGRRMGNRTQAFKWYYFAIATFLFNHRIATLF